MDKKEEISFRDKISTTNEEGSRSWIYINPPKGRLHNRRRLVSIVLLTLFFIGPFVRIDGEPLLLLNILQRKFVLFGKIFWPQDFHLFVIATLTLIVALILFTVIYGRIWCGWICPQTIFMEMIFRKIEFMIEGNAREQRKLDLGPMSFEKIWKKILKHTLFIFVSLLITHTMLSYIIGKERLFELFSEGPGAHFGTFSSFMIFTGVFYWVFSRFREQVCTLVCPYGRLQGVLLDSNSLIVAYDYKRGEQRGGIRKGENRTEIGKGDCINCEACVRVCPTGIDIRNGTQLECINCTACIDACNSVMKKTGFKPGLIRFASENEIARGQMTKFNLRIGAYSALLITLLSSLFILYSLRKDTETTILRVPGTLYQDMGNGEYTNMYNITVLNKSNHDIPVTVKSIQPDGRVMIIGHGLTVPKQTKTDGVFLFYLPKKEVNSSDIPVKFGLYSGDKLIETITSTFVGPDNLSNQ